MLTCPAKKARASQDYKGRKLSVEPFGQAGGVHGSFLLVRTSLGFAAALIERQPAPLSIAFPSLEDVVAFGGKC